MTSNIHFWIGMAMVTLSASVSSCSSRHQTSADDGVWVKIDTVSASANKQNVEYPGRVKAADEAHVGFKVAGTILRYLVKEGDFVRKGQVLVEMDARDYQLQAEAAEAEYQQIKAEAGRIIELYADSVVSADAYDKARYGLQQITAKRDHANNQLADTHLRAPFDGYVQRRLFDSGTIVGAGTPVISVISAYKTEIEINIPTPIYLQRELFAEYSATFDYLPGQTIPLTLKSIAPKANASQLFTTRLIIPADVNPQPAAGMNTIVTISLPDKTQGNVNIQAKALFQHDGKTCVWVCKDGRVTRREVTVEQLHTDGTATLQDGLTAGECIVTDGIHHLNEGQKVKPMKPISPTNVGGLL